jgi:cytochrome c oxidase assembly protein subunit 15
MSRPSRRAFARLALATTVATYLLILVGALVRAAGAGLGCPDWPRCFGQWIPPLSASQLPPEYDPAQFNAALTWLEYINRLIGVTIGLLIVATLVAAVRQHRREPHILWPALGAALMVGYQGWLGGQVVRSGLEPWMVTAHMVVALVIVTLLLYATYHAYHPSAERRRGASHSPRALARGATALIVLVLGQVALGTQVRSGIELALREQPALPRAQWLEQVWTLDHLHRSASLVVLAGVVALTVWILRRFREPDPLLRRAALTVLGLTVLQIVLGLILAYLEMPSPAQVLHLSVASLILGGLVLLAVHAGSGSRASPGTHR